MIKETNIMLDLNALPVLTLELAINDIVNDMLYTYFSGTSGINIPRGASKIAKIYGVSADAVAVEAEKRFDAAVEANVTRL